VAERPPKPTSEQIDAAIHRAADAARNLTRYPDRITMMPVPPTEDDLVDGRFWFIDWIVVVGEPDQWDVLYDPVMDEGAVAGEALMTCRA
jgi:hypothetical protein